MTNLQGQTSVKQSYDLKYSLTYDEYYQTFFLVADKWGKKIRFVLSLALALIAGVFIVLYAQNPYALHYFIIALLSCIMLLYAVYRPHIKAKKGARQMSRIKGTFKLELFKDGQIKLPNGSKINLQGDPDARAIETSSIFAIRPDKQNTFCIPKRILSADDINAVRNILISNMKRTKSLI